MPARMLIMTFAAVVSFLGREIEDDLPPLIHHLFAEGESCLRSNILYAGQLRIAEVGLSAQHRILRLRVKDDQRSIIAGQLLTHHGDRVTLARAWLAQNSDTIAQKIIGVRPEQQTQEQAIFVHPSQSGLIDCPPQIRRHLLIAIIIWMNPQRSIPKAPTFGLYLLRLIDRAFFLLILRGGKHTPHLLVQLWSMLPRHIRR